MPFTATTNQNSNNIISFLAYQMLSIYRGCSRRGRQKICSIKKGQKGVSGKLRMLSTEFALVMQGKSEANYLIAGFKVRLFFIAFGFSRI